ncbi:DNA polymerase III subunit delta [Cyanobacterium sp. IPPAS B-1200]|uniref:DNA polymerase III subunit delta n=1 Tax=Cyanobacterium sp. IPPAS B-1200 TaxID=1562720 RepID=UPI000852543F|nr:DNA polymerase III subunit delta [Cyanobacterium sp. IPPAS B-1200]OEJ78016.1 DNA polymerase III subunit delta [Cyanobacterium sp. IPPAS B-1200]
MPIYYYWGEDDFALNRAIALIKEDKIDPNWVQFNYEQINGDKEDNIRQALMEVMTPPFGNGDRFVWLNNTTICQSCSDELLSLLKNTLPQIPENSHLLLTSRKKPDARIKSTKLINKYTQIKEFSLIPIWQTDTLIKRVEETAQEKNIKLSPSAIKTLATCVGNDTRLLWQELDKLALYQGDNPQPITQETVFALVNVSNQNSLQLAQAILKQDTGKALQLTQELINLNEPALRIVATLVGQFRTWAMVKTVIESGEKDEKKIATQADVSNPKRIYFLRKEVSNISAHKLQSSLPILLDLELGLKRGENPLNALQKAIIQLSNLK